MSNNVELTRSEALAISRIPGVSTYRLSTNPQGEKIYVIMHKVTLNKGMIEAVANILGERMHRFEKLGQPGLVRAKVGLYGSSNRNRGGQGSL